MSLGTQICKMFELMTGLGCTFTIFLLADLDNMSLGYLYLHVQAIYPIIEFIFQSNSTKTSIITHIFQFIHIIDY